MINVALVGSQNNLSKVSPIVIAEVGVESSSERISPWYSLSIILYVVAKSHYTLQCIYSSSMFSRWNGSVILNQKLVCM